MCNIYQPASREFLETQWTRHISSEMQYKPRIGPRDNGPFVTAVDLRVGQWGMIRPGSRERVAKDRNGRAMMTNNARAERVATAPTYRDAWRNGARCLIPAESYDEPYWGTGKNIWWRFKRADQTPWMLAGLWSEWTDLTTGEIVSSYTMLTMNCDTHPLLRLMHKPDTNQPSDQQDKRSVVVIERADWDLWLRGSVDDATALIQLPGMDVFEHGPADSSKQIHLPSRP